MKRQVTLPRRTYFLMLIGTLLALLLTINFVHQVSAKENVDTTGYKSLKSFTDVLSLIQQNYVKEVPVDKVIEGAIKGMLLDLDPHSSYLPPEMYKELQVETKGEFGGLGIEITIKDNLLTVVAPIEDSPAYNAGIKAGDHIIKIGKQYTKDMSLVEAVKKMRGKKGTPITISVHRDGREGLIPITVVRDIIKVKSVRYRTLEDGYGYIRLSQFQEASTREFVRALEEVSKDAKDSKLKGLVIDLRNDPGGLLNQAVKISDIFLKEGKIVYTDGRLESQKNDYLAQDDGTEPDYPIVVLINGGSASASEIFAGAMQDSKRAIILGEQSFGKGSVQTIIPMENGSALRLTTALYYTRNGRSIQAEGITPDVIVAEKETEDLLDSYETESLELTRESDLPGAIENPKHGKHESKEDKSNKKVSKKSKKAKDPFIIGSRAAMSMKLPELLENDPQLDEALKILKNGGAIPVASPDSKEAKVKPVS